MSWIMEKVNDGGNGLDLLNFELQYATKDNLAVVDNGRKFTYEELHELSDRYANNLLNYLSCAHANSCKTEDILVGVCMSPCVELIAALVAIMKIGVAYLPFDPTFPKSRMHHMITESQPELILIQKKAERALFNDYIHVVDVSFWNPTSFRRTQCIQRYDQETFLVMYTSGSSGTPKGVRLGRKALLNRINWQLQTFPFVENEICTFKTSITFVDSVCEMFVPLVAGVPLVIVPKPVVSNPAMLIKVLIAHQVTRIVIVPSLLKAMLQCLEFLEVDKENLKLNLWVCSGETLSMSCLRDFFKVFPSGKTVCNLYGSTEVMADVTSATFTCLRDVEDRSIGDNVPIGLPIPNCRIHLLNHQMEEVGHNEIGEIYVEGRCLAQGYVNEGNKDKPKFLEHPSEMVKLYRTGDYAFMDSESGLFYYAGRQDSQVKIRGVRVDLLEIETSIAALVEVDQVVVLKVLSENPRIVAFLKLVDATRTTPSALEDRIRTTLREFEIPKAIMVVPRFPFLVNGKIDRQKLLRDYTTRATSDVNALETGILDRLEIPGHKRTNCRIVLEVVAKLLRLPVNEVARNHQKSFFNLGGTSLNSVTAILRMRQQQCFIDIQEFINAPSLEEVILLSQMKTELVEEERLTIPTTTPEKYKIRPLALDDFKDVSKIMVSSFTRLNQLWVSAKISKVDTFEYIASIWNEAIGKGLSFAVCNSTTGELLSFSINWGANDKPKPDRQLSKGFIYIGEMIAKLDSLVQNKPKEVMGPLLWGGSMGTLERLPPNENVELTILMERHVLNIAKNNKFYGSIAMYSSPLTLQTAVNVLGYTILAELNPREFAATDGSLPFQSAAQETPFSYCMKIIQN